MHPEILAPETASCFEKLKSQVFLQTMYLAGGTGVALWLGHRCSVDLDFFSTTPLNTLILQQQLTLQGKFTLDQEAAGTLHGTLNHVKLSFLEYSYPLLEPLSSYEGIAIAGLKDLSAMKLEAIAARGKKRDFFDVYAISKNGLSLHEMLLCFEKKYQSIQYNLLHLLKSLVYFNDAENDPEPILLHKISWEEVKNYFIKETAKIKI